MKNEMESYYSYSFSILINLRKKQFHIIVYYILYIYDDLYATITNIKICDFNYE